MSKSPRQTMAAPSTVDPREAPGSYIKTKDGYALAEPVTTPPAGASDAAPAPVIPAESAQAIAEALTDLGHDVPAFLEPAAPPASTDPVPTTGGDASGDA